MDEVAESAQVDPVAAEIALVNVDAAIAQDFVCVAERVEHGALAGAVVAEQQGDRPKLDPHWASDALEVLDLDG